jgi:UDP-2,4-diacetamido-2,4,6-trideoxy-beta-L-altropyranose hydrolase
MPHPTLSNSAAPVRLEHPLAVVFRLDCCDDVGAGHLTRCRSLAAELAAAGAPCGFVLGEPSRAAAALLAADGLPVHVTATRDAHRLDVDDAAATAAAARAWGAGALVVDHYGADAAYLERLATTGLAVGVVDDLGDRDLSAAAWILNQNLGAAEALYGDPGDRSLLVGPAFALLRPQFAAARETADRTFSPDDARVLVTYGGSAPASLYRDTIAALDRLERQLHVRVLAGAAADALAPVAAASRHRVDVDGHVDDMASAILWADVVVCAGGSTCWELLALGTPIVATSLSRDQEPNVAALAAAGLALAVAPGDRAAVGDAVGTLLAEAPTRARMSRLGRSHVDAGGARRAAASLLALLDPEGGRAAA